MSARRHQEVRRCRSPRSRRSGWTASWWTGTTPRSTCSATRCTTAAASSRDPGLRDRTRRRRLAPGRAPQAPVPRREALPHGHPVLARGAEDATKDVIRANGLRVVLHPAARVPRVRGDGREPAGRAGQRHDRGVAVGRLPRRGRAGAGRAGQGLQLAAQRAELAARRAKATGQYINCVLAKVESLKAGYDEAIMLNDARLRHRRVRRERLHRPRRRAHTPPTPAGSLDGITRDSLITLARDAGLRGPRGEPVAHRPLQRRRVLLHRHRRRDHADPRGRRPRGRARATAARSRRSSRARSSPPRRARTPSTRTGSPT